MKKKTLTLADLKRVKGGVGKKVEESYSTSEDKYAKTGTKSKCDEIK